MSPLDELRRLLRPAAGGIHTVSTGVSEQRALQRQIYGARDDAEVDARWRATLERLADARLVLLAVPTDVGAGFRRGAAFGPQAIRKALLDRHALVYREPSVVDVGDVFSVPQLLHDDMLSEAQLEATRRAIYGDDDDARALPVSPLSIAERALTLLAELAPRARTLVLGGDHAVGWPSFAAVARDRAARTGIVHFDAHTDLLPHRLGVRYCFATWAYHANERVGRGGRLQQLGLRISGRPREYWESTLGVRQFWMDEIRRRGAEAVAEEVVDNLTRAGVEGVYVSNDIDGTDPGFASATGTPEPGGLSPDEVEAVLRRVAERFPIWGSDLVEVAPPLSGHVHGEPARTLATAARYVELQARLTLAGT
jgi:agmatinase